MIFARVSFLSAHWFVCVACPGGVGMFDVCVELFLIDC